MGKFSSSALLCFISLVCVSVVIAKPVRRGPPPPKPVEGNSPESEDANTGLAYDHYLRQVVEVLESDPEFKKKLETANVSDIKSGKIAMYLEMVNHTVRTSLDELKRREIARLSELTRRQMMDSRGMEPDGGLILDTLSEARGKVDIPTHLDIRNPHSFEMKDLENLIKKTTADLEEMDKQRREEFKEYEMEKEYEKQQHLNELDEQKRKEEEKRLEELKKKHQQHPKLNHPGSKDQFEEVWDKQDHLEDQEFNPRTFFFTHDINGDMEWDIEEVDALLQLELDKVYEAKNSPEEDDPREREEEMARMREHVFKEMDKDKNFRISFNEFIDYTGRDGDNPEFKKDDGWKTVDEEPYFNEEEYQNYINQHHAQPGVVDPPSHDLQFQPEHQQQLENHIQNKQQQFQQQQQNLQQQQQQRMQQQQQQFQQQQFQQQQQQFQQQPPQHQQQQFQQPPQQQQHQQQPPQHQQQQQFQQPPQQQHNQQQPPQHQQQQFQQPPPNQPPGGPRNPPHPPQQNDNVVNMNQQPQTPEEQEKLKQQLKELQDKLNQQQQHQQDKKP